MKNKKIVSFAIILLGVIIIPITNWAMLYAVGFTNKVKEWYDKYSSLCLIILGAIILAYLLIAAYLLATRYADNENKEKNNKRIRMIISCFILTTVIFFFVISLNSALIEIHSYRDLDKWGNMKASFSFLLAGCSGIISMVTAGFDTKFKKVFYTTSTVLGIITIITTIYFGNSLINYLITL